MTYTDAFIDYLNNTDYMDNPYEKEYTPSFLDSIADLEAEENIIPFPTFDWEPIDPAPSAWAA